MSNNIRMLMVNQWDRAEISVSTGTVVPTLPLVNSQRYGRSRTSAITPNSNGISAMQFNMPEFNIIDGLVLYRHWLSNSAQWRIELFEDLNCTGNKIYDSGFVDAVPAKNLGELEWLADPLVATIFEAWPFKFSQLWLDEWVSCWSGRITLKDVDARDGIHEFDRIYIGQTVQPSVNFDYGHQHEWQSNEQHKRSVAGSVYAAPKERLRRFTFDVNHVNEEERPHFSNGIRYVGMSKDWFVSMFPSNGGQKEVEYAMSCKFTQLPALTGSAYNTYRGTFVLQES